MSAGVSAWFTRATEIMSAYSPASWWFAALIGGGFFAISVASVFAISQKYKLWRSTRRYIELTSKPYPSINPLEKSFDGVSIKLDDLNPPIHSRQIISDKTMTNCRILGPQNVLVSSGTLSKCTHTNCDYVLVGSDKQNFVIYNAIMLENCHLIDCELVGLTFYVPNSMQTMFESMDGFRGWI